MAIWERDGHIIEDASGHPLECDVCPCPPPRCDICWIFQSRPGHEFTDYKQIIGVACDEDCSTAPHLLGTYDLRAYHQEHPDYTGCVWWEWASLTCRTWYGVDEACIPFVICQERVCDESDSPSDEFVPGCYRIVFDFRVYSNDMVETVWDGFTPTCRMGEPGRGWIDPVYYFDDEDELQDYIDYIEDTTRSNLHVFTAGMSDGECILFIDGSPCIGEQRYDFVLNRYELFQTGEGDDCAQHPVIPNAYRSEGDI